MYNPISIFAALGDACSPYGGGILSFPHWYKYLPGIMDAQDKCIPQVTSLSVVWLILIAVIEILLRIAAIAAVAMIIYGGTTYITSQGEPDKVARSKGTVINALIGLGIAIIATATITFIAGSIK